MCTLGQHPELQQNSVANGLRGFQATSSGGHQPHPWCDQGLGYNSAIMSRTLASGPNPIAQYLFVHWESQRLPYMTMGLESKP